MDLDFGPLKIKPKKMPQMTNYNPYILLQIRLYIQNWGFSKRIGLNILKIYLAIAILSFKIEANLILKF